jgi:hypothetical protein
MKKICLAAACGAALLAVSGFANAQESAKSPSANGTALNKCWDSGSDVVRDRSGTFHWNSQEQPPGMRQC